MKSLISVSVESTDLECNYSDNYYGDQVCIPKT